VQPVARRYVNVDPECLLEILLDPDEVEAVASSRAADPNR
jgi:hypothetical protein